VHPLNKSNYFTDAAVKSIKGDGNRALLAFEKLVDMNPHWGKEEKWKIAREMTMTT
jgi:hypothetical protein